jgi:hypothetical protein
MPHNAKNFLSQIVAMLPAFRAVERQLDKNNGRRFLASALFDPNENASSRILADLLDPNGSHGQEDIFLRLFISIFLPDWEDTFQYGKAKIVCEHMTDKNRRIDITLTDGNYWIGVENKFRGAGDQENQIGHYLAFLKEKNRPFRLIYLSPDGQEPTSIAISQNDQKTFINELISIAWIKTESQKRNQETPPKKHDRHDIQEWLDACYKECVPENVRWFLKDFSDFVRGKKETDMVEDVIISHALSNTEHLEAAMRIGNLLKEIQSKAARNFLEALQKIMGNDWNILNSFNNDDSHNPILRNKNWPKYIGVAISKEDGGWSLGIKAPPREVWMKWESVDTRLLPQESASISPSVREELQKIDPSVQNTVFQSKSNEWWPLRFVAGEIDAFVEIHKATISMKKNRDNEMDNEIVKVIKEAVQIIDNASR